VFSVAGWLAITYLSAKLPIGYIQLNQNAIPIVTAAIGYFFLREVVTRLESIALCVCFSVITITGLQKTEFAIQDDAGRALSGEYTTTNILLCLLSVLSFAVINIIGRLLKGHHYSVLCTAQFTLNVVFSMLLALLVCD